jgi:hypothetical protein
MKSASFFEKCKGIALVFCAVGVMLFGIAAILFSATPAQADAPQTMYATGKYQMSMTSVITSDDKSAWYLIVWDTETGRSKMYYGSVREGTNLAISKFQLPSSPL